MEAVKSKIKVLAGSANGKRSLPGLWGAAFSLCCHRSERADDSSTFIGTSVPIYQISTLLTSFNPDILETLSPIQSHGR